MKEIQLFLRPAPGAKPEFLAQVKPVLLDPAAAAAPVQQIWDAVVLASSAGTSTAGGTAAPPNDTEKNTAVVAVVLDDYTRDGWAWKPSPRQMMHRVTVESTDGRNKLPGFVHFLKQRQKSAYGRFGSAGVWVVSYVQQQQQQQQAKSNSNYRMDCRICTDFQSLPGCNLKPRMQPQQQQQQQPSSVRRPPPAAVAAAAPAAQRPQPQPSANRKKGGLLGKLVGAQHRTNQHVIHAQQQAQQPAAPARRPAQQLAQQAPPSAHAAAGASSNRAPPAAAAAAAAAAAKTVPEVFAEFRQFCQDTMLDFDLAPDRVLKVPVALRDICQDLPESERPRVTMDVLKYMVYEAAEEVNEEWVAVKEPSEFLDEVVIAVYKEGAAPPEVLEDFNRGELPDEVRGQQQALQTERARLLAQQESRRERQLEQQAHGWGDGDGGEEEEDKAVAALNTKKRDRRTIEDYEREKRENAAKRGKS